MKDTRHMVAPPPSTTYGSPGEFEVVLQGRCVSQTVTHQTLSGSQLRGHLRQQWHDCSTTTSHVRNISHNTKCGGQLTRGRWGRQIAILRPRDCNSELCQRHLVLTLRHLCTVLHLKSYFFFNDSRQAWFGRLPNILI